MERADIELVNSFLPGDFVSGKATGNLKISGDTYSPSTSAELVCENVTISNFSLESLELNSQIIVNDAMPSGFIDIKAGKGQWKHRSFDSGTVSASIENRSIILENCHFKSGSDFLQASGYFDGLDKYQIDRVQFAYQDNYLVNAKPLHFVIQDSMFYFDPFELHINDGMMEGVVSGGNRPEGRFKMSNFDAEVLTQFIDDHRLKMTGLIFGEILVDDNKNGFEIDVDLSFKNGSYMEEPFDEMIISGLYKNGILHLDDLSMTKEKSIGLNIDGVIPLRSSNNHVAISMESSFSNLSLKFIHRFIPQFFNIGGLASGRINLKGTSSETHFSYDVNIDQPQFELVQMANLKSKGKYNGRYLFVESAKAKNKNGFINASGYIPFDFNIGSSEFGNFFIEDSIKLKTEADLSDLPFLSPYIDDLDSADGNYKMNLNIEGPIENLKRDGKNLHYDLYISYSDAVLGCNPEIQSISSKVKIKLDEGIQSGKILRLRGKGLPSVDRYGTGDLLVHVNVWTPQNIDKKQRAFFEACKDEGSFKPDPDKNNKSFFDKVKEIFQ